MLRPVSGAVKPYDLLVCTLGYEPRCRNIASLHGSSAEVKVAYSFESKGMFSFDENEFFFESVGFEKVCLEGDLISRVVAAISTGSAKFIGVDVSSMTRALMVNIVAALWDLGDDYDFLVDFWYSPPKFDPSRTPSAVIESADLIHPRLAGLGADPLAPVAGIIGVGYEPNLSVGIAEYLDLSNIHAFVPQGHDTDFDMAVEEANRALFEGEVPCARSVYDVYDPYSLLSRLESLSYGLASHARVALVPLGPKIFSLCSFLAALYSEDPIAVWRFSGGVGSAGPTETEGEPVRLRLRGIVGGTLIQDSR